MLFPAKYTHTATYPGEQFPGSIHSDLDGLSSRNKAYKNTSFSILGGQERIEEASFFLYASPMTDLNRTRIVANDIDKPENLFRGKRNRISQDDPLHAF